MAIMMWVAEAEGSQVVLMRPMNTMTPFPRRSSRSLSLCTCAWPAKISFNDVCVVPHKMPSPSMVSFGVTAREITCVELIQWHAWSLVVLQFNNCMCQGQISNHHASKSHYHISKRRHIYIGTVTVYRPLGSDTADFISNLQTGINEIPANNTVVIVGCFFT